MKLLKKTHYRESSERGGEGKEGKGRKRGKRKEKREKEGKEGKGRKRLVVDRFLAYISSQTRPKYWT